MKTMKADGKYIRIMTAWIESIVLKIGSDEARQILLGRLDARMVDRWYRIYLRRVTNRFPDGKTIKALRKLSQKLSVDKGAKSKVDMIKQAIEDLSKKQRKPRKIEK